MKNRENVVYNHLWPWCNLQKENVSLQATVCMLNPMITLNYSVKNTWNDVRQIIYIYIYIYEKSQFNSLVWGSLTLAQIIQENRCKVQSSEAMWVDCGRSSSQGSRSWSRFADSVVSITEFFTACLVFSFLTLKFGLGTFFYSLVCLSCWKMW